MAASFVLIGSCTGCATLPPGSPRDPRDHFERFNRAMFKFDIGLDHAVLRPVARAYVKVTPSPVRTGISNFLGNLAYTTTIVNDVFQAPAATSNSPTRGQVKLLHLTAAG
ncbi:MAG: MlaA family lipoprotein [Steroidobacteraceae bacterium]